MLVVIAELLKTEKIRENWEINNFDGGNYDEAVLIIRFTPSSLVDIMSICG